MFKILLEWLKRIVRAGRDSTSTEHTIECNLEGVQKQRKVVGVSGLCLVVDDKDGRWLVAEYQAVDNDEFWRIWKRLSGDVELSWGE